MTETQFTPSLWEFDWFSPEPHQDSKLVQQLGFVPGLQDLLKLRQVHGLEHATVWVLSEMAPPPAAPPPESDSLPDNQSLGGLSTQQGFYLYGQVSQQALQRAVQRALQRLKGGEWHLALHPRCGTNLSVTFLLAGGLALGMHLLLPRTPLEQLMGLGVAATMAAQFSPEVGISVQKYLTTAIPFNLELLDIFPTQDFWGRPAHFVRLRWQD